MQNSLVGQFKLYLVGVGGDNMRNAVLLYPTFHR